MTEERRKKQQEQVETSEKANGQKEKAPETGKEPAFTVIEALSASGLRSCRYALECQGIGKIVANDLSLSAVEEIKENVKFNQVEGIVQPNCDDAINLLINHRGQAKYVTHSSDGMYLK